MNREQTATAHQPSTVQEIAMLQSQERMLLNDLKAIRERIEKLTEKVSEPRDSRP